MRIALPPPRRGPRFSDLIYVEGTAMAIEAMPLYQPDAPKAYLVEAPRGMPRRIAWDGLRWSTETLKDEAHGEHGSLRSLPAAGSIPASSEPTSGESPTSSGVESGHAPIPLTGYPPEPTQESESRKGIAVERRNGQKQDRSQRRGSVRPARKSEASPFIAQNRAGAAEALRTNHRGESFPSTMRKDRPRSRELQALHDLLDQARLDHVEALEGTNLDRIAETFQRRTDLIAQLDVADPAFYGRPRADEQVLVGHIDDCASTRSREEYVETAWETKNREKANEWWRKNRTLAGQEEGA